MVFKVDLKLKIKDFKIMIHFKETLKRKKMLFFNTRDVKLKLKLHLLDTL